jgi:hypothetical protein
VKYRPDTTTSERQLCVALAATGRTASLGELLAWRKDGLLPSMASTGLGTGKGKSYYWREDDILARAQAVYDAMRRHGRPDQALITLFLSGFAVPLGQLRRAWLHRAKARKPAGVRFIQKSPDRDELMGPGVDSILLQAALCAGVAMEAGDTPEGMPMLLDRALSKLGLVERGANDSGLADPLWHLLGIIGSILDSSDLVREACDDELLVAQRHLGVVMGFLQDCSVPSDTTAETLGPQLFLFILTLLRSGQSRTLERMMAYVGGWPASVPPARSISQAVQA